MDFNARRLWMDNRLFPGRRGIRPEYEEGLKEFVAVATRSEYFLRHGMIKCPCIKCKCCVLQDITTAQLHLLDKGFMPDYYIWRYHGEPWDLQEHIQMLESIHGTSSHPVVEPDSNDYRMEDMVQDAFGMYPDNDPMQPGTSQPNLDHIPNPEASQFYKMLEKKEKRTIPLLELHKLRHTKGGKKGEGVWVEPRAKEVWEKATKAVEDWTATQVSDVGSSTPAPLTFEREKEIWVEAVGGVKKGSLYGLGSLFASDKQKASYLGSSAASPPPSSIDPAEFARMKEVVENMAKVNQETQDMIKQLLSQKQPAAETSRRHRSSKHHKSKQQSSKHQSSKRHSSKHRRSPSPESSESSESQSESGSAST